MSRTKLKKFGATAGIAFPILQMSAQGLIQVGGSEPPFTAAGSEILEFFMNQDTTLFAVGDYISALSMIAFLWFLGALWNELRAVEGESAWLSTIALGSGLVTASAFSVGGWSLAIFRISEGLDPQIARLLFDQGNFNFANMWISLSSMVLACGVVFHSTDAFPKWLGWSSILLAIGLVLARAVWTSQVAFAPYVLFWVWMIALSIILMRRTKGNKQQSPQAQN
jgi:hypothetical protein